MGWLANSWSSPLSNGLQRGFCLLTLGPSWRSAESSFTSSSSGRESEGVVCSRKPPAWRAYAKTNAPAAGELLYLSLPLCGRPWSPATQTPVHCKLLTNCNLALRQLQAPLCPLFRERNEAERLRSCVPKHLSWWPCALREEVSATWKGVGHLSCSASCCGSGVDSLSNSPPVMSLLSVGA